MIQNIPIDEIATHPKNLRKDLGDLTELTESIKNVGILQNLTIIPCFQVKETILNENIKYYALIGNRRLSAAKLVGLLEVPCIIADINESEQVATMLLENMQRSDLTVYEQAQGVQMMLDLGEDMATIANKTGFSESTIRRRVKLLDLDKEKFKAAEDRGATLADYAELEKIEDINVKNKVLESIGTHNFKWELNKAIEDEENKKKKQRILKLVEYYALKVDTTEGYIKK
ncbi:MAG: ParB/RepB/Spo0J family partition protein, partial [Defluviitaleaceae bacterium]|nr:ParB/RepB/Spo0J family partition protein [Defluviitaleaceae bacterium]